MKRFSKLLSVVLLLGMLLSLLPAAALAEGETTRWSRISPADVAEGDTVTVTMTTGEGKTYALANAAVGKNPAAPEVTVNGNTMTAADNAAISWTLTAVDGGYTFTSGSNTLNISDITKAQSVRISTDAATVFKLNEAGTYLTVTEGDKTRELGVFINSTGVGSWRHYDPGSANIADETVSFWKLVTTSAPKPDPQPSKYLELLTEAPASGAQLVIYHPTSGKALNNEVNDKKLVGAAGTLTDGKLGLLDTMSLLTVGVEGEGENAVYSFALGGQYLTSGATGNSLSFAEKSDLSGWKLERSGDHWRIINTTAVYGTDNQVQALEYYEGFTTYSVRDTDPYKFDLYAERPAAPTVDVAAGEVEADTHLSFSCATPGAVISYSTDGTTWTAGTEYTVTEAVTLQLRANLGGLLSDTLTLAYTVKEPEPAVSTIAEALAGEADASFRVKGVVTMIEGKNVFVQDATGGICLYFDTAVTDLALGDTVIFEGVRKTHNNLPELTGQTYQKSSGLTLEAKETTIDALTTADLCTYVKLTGLEVTEVYDQNGTFANPNITVKDASDNTIQIYKAVVTKTDDNWRVKVGDVIDLCAAIGINKSGDLQLRNTLDSEISVKSEQPPEPPTPAAGAIKSLEELTNGLNVVIYSPTHKTSISNKPNGDSAADKDWYLKAIATTVTEGKLESFTEEQIWTVKVNADGSYGFYAYNDDTRGIAVWASGSYAELSVDAVKRTHNTWNLAAAATEDCFYISSATLTGTNKNGVTGPAYVEAFTKNGSELYSGFFCDTENLVENDYALQFYPVDPSQATETGDDGTWDGVIEKGKQVLVYNATAQASMGLTVQDTKSLSAVATTIADGKAVADNGAYAFTVDTMGRYYSFEIDGQYLATNTTEELFFVAKDENGKLPEAAKWYLSKNGDGYVIYNKEVTYNGTPVCIEFFSSCFSGWTFKSANAEIFQFNFYEPAEDTHIIKGVVQAPKVIFDGPDSRYVAQDYACEFTLDDLADEIGSVAVSFTAGGQNGTVSELTLSDNKKAGSFTIPAAELDGEKGLTSFTVKVEVSNSFGISYSGEKTIQILDEPFFTELKPEPNAQTGSDLKPVISAKVGNAGENPSVTMTLNDKPVEAVYADGVVSYTPAEDLAKGRASVTVTVERGEDGVKAEKTWSFTVGTSAYQLYFGQLHSHTTYSDGSGSLDAALEYVANLPASANVQFVAFTDHSNYFDTTAAASPADALNDKSLMTEASRAKWEEYKSKVAAFNEAHAGELVAIAGFEMTWSGGPGHINTFDSAGLVSRNNAELNNKSGDAGMKLYYQTINKGSSMSQFNHPGTTFGTFTDFSYWDAATDAHMFLVEVGNGEGAISAVGNGYYPSYEQYIVALDKGWHLAPTNNQDNHKGRWGNANDARDVILTNDFSEAGIYAAIRAMRIYATEDKNLQIYYNLNGSPMGTVFAEDNVPEKINIDVTVFDPDTADSISKVEVVVNGGVTAYTWDNPTDLASGQLKAELNPEYSYYFIRVTENDGDLAVTAPVWVGKALKLGIEEFKAPEGKVYKGEEATLTASFFNQESKDATIKSLTYTINGSEVIGTDTTGYSLSANGTQSVEFKHSFDKAKLTTVTVTAVVEFEGKEYTFTANVEIDVLNREDEGKVSTIAEVREASKEDDTGYRFEIEGIVSSNASGYDKDTAFFDCIYVQDETGGICCFPVAGEFKIGDKVHVVGHTDFYQGEPELQVESIEIIGEGSVEPTEITAEQLNTRAVEGLLVTVKGTVESFELANGLIQTIMVRDAEGKLARVFIDGYITTDKEVENCEVGAQVEATGLASFDNTFNAPDGPFPRIRIRDRADVVCVANKEELKLTLDPTGGTVDPTEIALNADGSVPALPTPVKENAIFVGWFDAAEGGTEVKEGDVLTESKTLYAHWTELRVSISDELVVPAALQGTYASVDAMKSAMHLTVMKRLSIDEAKGEQYNEVKAEYFDGNGWQILPADMFPAEGIIVEMPYPDGSAKTDEFVVLHIFGEDCNGHKAGMGEMPAVTKGENSLRFKMNGTSPILLVWNEPQPIAAPTVSPAPGNVTEGTELTFSCETEGAKIYYSTDGGETWTEGSSYKVTADVTILVKAVKDGEESETVSFTYKVVEAVDPVVLKLDPVVGTVKQTEVKVGSDGKVPELPAPQERSGYVFGGWFTEKEGGVEVKKGDTVTESMTLYAHWYELRASVSTNTVVPTALKSTYASVDAMKSAMLKTVEKRLGTTSVKGNKLYEIKVEYNQDGTWKTLTADMFPTIGVKVTMTIPTGSTANDRFVVLHLFGEDCNGHKAGEGEMPTVTKSGTTLTFTIHGTSPLLLVWTGSSGTTKKTTPATGDMMVVWLSLMAASAAAITVIAVVSKKKKSKT